MNKYHIRITEEITTETALAKGSDETELLSIRVDEDPSKAIMRLLAAEKRGPRKKANETGARKPATGEAKA
jgi:hypothetical protein